MIACCLAGVQSPAAEYEDFLVRWQFRPWTAVLLAEAAILPGERILDLATGTGIVAREAAPFVGDRGRVVALDINPAMLAVARSLPEPAGASIEWLEGDAAALPLPDAAFDAVLCQQGLQYFANRPAAAAEVRRVLASGGRALLVVWQALAHNPVQEVLNAAGQCRVGVAPLATAFGLGEADEVGSLFRRRGSPTLRLPAASWLSCSRHERSSPVAWSRAWPTSYRSWPDWTHCNVPSWQARSTKTPV